MTIPITTGAAIAKAGFRLRTERRIAKQVKASNGGIAVAQLALTRIQTNLLPSEISRQRLWRQKRPWFAVAAALIVGAVGGVAWRATADARTLNPASNPDLTHARSVVSRFEDWKSQYNKVKGLDQ